MASRVGAAHTDSKVVAIATVGIVAFLGYKLLGRIVKGASGAEQQNWINGPGRGWRR